MTDAPLRLVIFDVDGTLVDSQLDILSAMEVAFEGQRLAAPSKTATLGIVGLSLNEAMQVLAPDQSAATWHALVKGYKAAYMELRAKAGVEQSSPLYPGVRDTLDRLQAVPHVLLGVATGKSRRGLDKLIEGHGLQGYFVTQQVADHHPSKPHPSMIKAALAETGVVAKNAVMVGDTSFDMEMAAAAGVVGIGASWGYHARPRLKAACHLVDDMTALPALLKTFWRELA